MKERLSSEDYERETDFERKIVKKIVKGRLKDRLRANCWKRKPAEIWDSFLPIFPHFCQIKKMGYGPTDQPTDPTDIPSYRDAWTHLKDVEPWRPWTLSRHARDHFSTIHQSFFFCGRYNFLAGVEAVVKNEIFLFMLQPRFPAQKSMQIFLIERCSATL